MKFLLVVWFFTGGPTEPPEMVEDPIEVESAEECRQGAQVMHQQLQLMRAPPFVIRCVAAPGEPA